MLRKAPCRLLIAAALDAPPIVRAELAGHGPYVKVVNPCYCAGDGYRSDNTWAMCFRTDSGIGDPNFSLNMNLVLVQLLTSTFGRTSRLVRSTYHPGSASTGTTLVPSTPALRRNFSSQSAW